MGRKIMIIDDEEEMLEIMGLLLESFGCEPLPHRSAREALDLAIEEKPEMIFLDLMMSPMTGLEFLEERRKNKDLLKIPVVIFTAWGLKPEEYDRFKDEIETIIVKPVDPIEIQRVIENTVTV